MISIIIPAYNEADRIVPMLSDIECYCKENPGIISEVIIVDDGSKDATVECAMRYMFRLPLHIERMAKNCGKWAAIREGIHSAKNDALLLLDADGAASIFELKKLNVVEILDEKIAILGSRFLKGATVEGKSGLRSVVSFGYRGYVKFWYWFASGRMNVDDMQAPFKLVFKSHMSGVLLVDRWVGDVELMCCYQGSTRNVPLNFCHKRGSKVSVLTMFSMAFETIKIAWRCRKIYR